MSTVPVRSPRATALVGLLSIVILAIALLALAPVPSRAASSVCPSGEAAGECANPRGMGVDSETGRLYIADGGNNRIDVFNADTATFVEAFGWGVVDGKSEPQTCTTSCRKGLAGGGAGEFSNPTGVTVDNTASASRHDIYVFGDHRVQRLSPAGQFIAAWGGGVVTAGARGTGNLTSGSNLIAGAVTTEGSFQVAQTITGTGIPSATRITAVGDGTITLSKPAGSSGSSTLSVAAGSGHLPQNEVQKIAVTDPRIGFALSFSTLPPDSTFDKSPSSLTFSSSAAEIQAVAESLSNIGPGNIEVTGPFPIAGGGHYFEIEFKGRFADTDVGVLTAPSFEGNAFTTVIQNGAGAAEVCTAAEADDCASGVEWTAPEGSDGEGVFGSNIADSNVLAIGPGGEVYVSDRAYKGGNEEAGGGFVGRVQIFEPSGAFVEQHPLFEAGVHDVNGLAITSTGDFYATIDGAIVKYASSGAELDRLPAEGADAEKIALDSSGDLFALTSGGDGRTVTEYDPAGAVLARFGYGSIVTTTNDLALHHTASGDVFLSEGSGSSATVQYLKLPPAGPVAAPTVQSSGITSTKASLEAEINPEGKQTEYVFQYLTQADYEAQGESFVGSATKSTQPQSLGAEDFRLHQAESQIGCADPVQESAQPGNRCLVPKTTYRWRIVAENTDGEKGEGTVEGGRFTTSPPLEILAVWPTAVGTDSTVLHVEANPLGIPTTGYFEYVTDAVYQANLQAGRSPFAGAVQLPGGANGIDFGSGEEPVSRSSTAFPLDEGTTYHFRAVLSDPLLSEPVLSEARELTTFSPSQPSGCAKEGTRGGLVGARFGSAAFLLDCRAYEMVSPIDKNGGDVVYNVSPEDHLPATLEQSSTDGSRMAYTALTPFAEPAGSPPVSQYVASRRAGQEWKTDNISSRRERLLTKGLSQLDAEFEAFSPDLCQGWLRTLSDPPLAEGAVAGNLNLYRRQDEECGGESYEPITTTPPENVSVPTRNALELRGVSASGGRVLYKLNDTLPASGAPAEPTACRTSHGTEPGTCLPRLYSQSAEEGSRYVCVLPNGAPASSCEVGSTSSFASEIAQRNRAGIFQGAISADGSRIFWSTPAPGEGKIYMRDSHGTAEAGDDTTLAVSQAGEALAGSSRSLYRCAAANGSKAIYSTDGKLFEFYPDGGTTDLIVGELVGIGSCSQDASRVYLATREVLGGQGVDQVNSEGAEAVAGQPNLYFYEASATPGEAGSYAFIGTLAGSDVSDAPPSLGPVATQPTNRLSRVTPSGGALAFMSAAPLTGFDNTDADRATPDMEVFLYRVDTDKLVCASCDSTGARPVSAGINRNAGGPPWAAAEIPVWENGLYAARALADDGQRLFFESANRLVSRDTNGHIDVYEWEAPGTGTCTTSSTSYVEADGGCIDLISSGQDDRNVEFRDASPSGDDVFFATQESLLPQDPGNVDIYDARVGGGLPVPQPPAPACEGEACQSPPAPPNDPSPASSAFNGPGNLVEPASKKPRCPRQRQRGSAARGAKQRCSAGKPGRPHHKKKGKQPAHHRRTDAKRGGSR